MGTIYGYARCSTNETRQDIDRQKRELRQLGVISEKNIFFEYDSGCKTDRVELQKLFNVISDGDSIIATEVSRLTRSTKHLCEIINLVQNRRIRLIIGSFVVDCRDEEIDPMTKGMLMMWGVFSEMERDIISMRVKSGMLNAKAKGKRIGRPKTIIGNLPHRFFQFYPLFKDKQITITDFARILECSRTSVYKYIAIVENE